MEFDFLRPIGTTFGQTPPPLALRLKMVLLFSTSLLPLWLFSRECLSQDALLFIEHIMSVSGNVPEFLHLAAGPSYFQQVHLTAVAQPEMSPRVAGGVNPDGPFDLPNLL